MSTNFTTVLIFAGAIFLGLLAIGMIFARLYRRSSKEVSFVRTGLWRPEGDHERRRAGVPGAARDHPGQHEHAAPRSAPRRRAGADHQGPHARRRAGRVLRPRPADRRNRSPTPRRRSAGGRWSRPTLKELVEGKFVDALRAVAAEMAMEELHEQRVNFVQKVQAAVSEDILKNGLELESVSLTGLDQTNREFFNPDNVFDAEGLTKLTQAIEERRKTRNDIEQETQVVIERKNLEARSSRSTRSAATTNTRGSSRSARSRPASASRRPQIEQPAGRARARGRGREDPVAPAGARGRHRLRPDRAEREIAKDRQARLDIRSAGGRIGRGRKGEADRARRAGARHRRRRRSRARNRRPTPRPTRPAPSPPRRRKR